MCEHDMCVHVYDMCVHVHDMCVHVHDMCVHVHDMCVHVHDMCVRVYMCTTCVYMYSYMKEMLMKEVTQCEQKPINGIWSPQRWRGDLVTPEVES